MEKFEFMLFEDSDGERRTFLQHGDTLFIKKKDQTVGFLRRGMKLYDSDGRDKFFTNNYSCVVESLRHFGIITKLIDETEYLLIYELLHRIQHHKVIESSGSHLGYVR